MEVGTVRNLNFGNVSFSEFESGNTVPIQNIPPKTDTDKVELNVIKANDVNDFYEHFADKNWEKKYNTDLEVVLVKSKNPKEKSNLYIIENNGMVKEIDGTSHKANILIDEDENLAKFVDKKRKATEKEEKPKTSLKDKFANIWKFFSNFKKMTGATFKGLYYGAITGVSTLGGAWLLTALPKAFKHDGPKFVEVLTKPIKNTSTMGKVIAGLTAISVFGYHIINGKLNANKRTADIDHELYTGHRDR